MERSRLAVGDCVEVKMGNVFAGYRGVVTEVTATANIDLIVVALFDHPVKYGSKIPQTYFEFSLTKLDPIQLLGGLTDCRSLRGCS